MNQSAITCFLSAARTGSFAETARELYMSRQAVSKNIQELEREVGFPLFFSKCTPLTLTVAGEKLRGYYAERDYNMNVAKRIFDASFFNTKYLRIGWGRWIMPNHNIIDAIAKFNKVNDIKLSVVAGTEKESLENLRTGEADVAFLSKYVCSMLKEPYSAIELSEEPIRIALPKDSVSEENGDIDDVIRNMTYLTCSAGESDDAEIRGRVNRSLMYFKYPPKSIRILPNVETIQLQIMLGHGFTCIPNAHSFSPHVQALYLDERDGAAPSATMCMVWLRRNQNTEIYNLRDWMLKQKELFDD